MAPRNLKAGFLLIWIFISARALAADLPPFQNVTIGLCEDYPEESRSIEAAQRDLVLLQTNHIRVLRVAFGWDAIEPAPGKYDWRFWDDFVRIAGEHGVTLIPYVCYTPKWNSAGSGKDFWRQPPKDNARFAEFVKQAVLRYKNQIHSWEIWNEPDNHAYWEGSAEQFAELLKAGSRAVREADPTAKVVSGGIAWDLNFLKTLFAQYQVSSFIDVVNLHCYFETWSGEPLETIGDYVLRANRLIEQYGNHQAIWLAEVGYSTFRKGAFVSYDYSAKYPFEHTARFQAESLARALASALATGKVSLIAWYRIHDLGEKTDIIGDVNNRHLGVLDVNGIPKPTLAALRFLTSVFSGGIRSLDDRTRACRNVCSDSEIHVFEKKTGELIATAWLRIVNFDRCEPAGNRAGAAGESLSLDLPVAGAMHAQRYDETGQRQRNSPLENARQWKHADLDLQPGSFVLLVISANTDTP